MRGCCFILDVLLIQEFFLGQISLYLSGREIRRYKVSWWYHGGFMLDIHGRMNFVSDFTNIMNLMFGILYLPSNFLDIDTRKFGIAKRNQCLYVNAHLSSPQWLRYRYQLFTKFITQVDILNSKTLSWGRDIEPVSVSILKSSLFQTSNIEITNFVESTSPSWRLWDPDVCPDDSTLE